MATYYRSKHGNPQTSYHPSNRANGQVIIVGADGEVPVEDGIFWLESIETGSGVTVEIQDGDGNTVIPAVGSVNHEMSPIRLDRGIKIVGTVLYAKGFIMDASLDSIGQP